jgi:hypothetical protein
VFSVGLYRGYVCRIKTQASQSKEVKSLEGVCRQTHLSKSEAVVRQSPLVEAWDAEEPHCCKSLHSSAELVVRQLPASKEHGS